MSTKNKVMVLDWDGTIHNTSHLYGVAFRKAYQWLIDQGHIARLNQDKSTAYSMQADTYNDVYMERYLGMNSKDMWNQFMPELADEIKDQASQMVGDGMVSQVKAGQAILYPKALEALKALKKEGWTLVFLSNCKRAYMEAHREAFHLDDYYDGFYCCQDYDFIPKEEIWPHIEKDFPGQHVIVGDRASDLKIASTHHLPAIGCMYGFGTREEMSLADQIARSVEELPRLAKLLVC